MEVIYLNGQQLNMNEPICSAVGFFDGLHIGHMALIHEVKKLADEKKYKTALMTFDHSPSYVLGYVNEDKYLTSMDDRKEILEQLGFDYLLIIQFTKEVASLSPLNFIQSYLIHCHIKHIVCGFDFCFGTQNLGNVETLKSCHEFETTVIAEVDYQNEKISSSRIRAILNNGKIDDINALLGRKYCVQGKVIPGRRIGHSIGFPTANIDYQSYFLPCHGVYAVKVKINNESYLGMCNIGYNPTFVALDKASLEVYIFDFDKDIYGEYIRVEFYSFVREEKPFSSSTELIHQLKSDKNYIRSYFQTQE